MKDFKSYIIGFLTCACMFLIMGQTWGKKNLSDTEDNSKKTLVKLQNETNAHYIEYAAQMDSIDIVFEEIKFSIEQLEEVLTRKIDRVKDDVRNLEDSFETFKRSTKRTERDMKQKISTIQDDINTLNATVFPPAEEQEKKKWN